jgi:hypothetical protein
MTDRVTENGRCYGTKINVDNIMGMSRKLSTLENVEYFSYLSSVITNYARCTREIKSRIVTAKSAFKKEKTHFASRLDLNLRKKLVKRYIWSTAFYSTESWILQKVDQKYLKKFWNVVLEKISQTDHVRNKELLHRTEEERSILQTINTSCIGTFF